MAQLANRPAGNNLPRAPYVYPVARFTQALHRWQERRQIRRELHALSDRELADIGITRGEIGRLVRSVH